jgi:ribosomal protein S4
MQSKSILNRRCAKTIHKKYRRYGCDIWGRLAIKKKNDFITKLVYKNAQRSLRKRLRSYTRKQKATIWRKFRSVKRRRKRFSFDITTKVLQKRKRTSSRRGLLLKLRRKISLYYGGGRIRRKTFRRYGRMSIIKRTKSLNHLQHSQYATSRTYTSIIESRLDVLLLRSNFVDSVYKARTYIFNHKCKITGNTKISHPAFLIKNFQIFGLKDHYTRKLRKSLFTRIKKHAVVNIPSYLHVNFSLLIAFKSEDPIVTGVSYPFAEQAGSLGNFRKLFQLL